MKRQRVSQWTAIAALFIILFAAWTGGVIWLASMCILFILGIVMYQIKSMGLLWIWDDVFYPLLFFGFMGWIIYHLIKGLI